MLNSELMALHNELEAQRTITQKLEAQFAAARDQKLIEAFGYVTTSGVWSVVIDYNLWLDVTFDTDIARWYAIGCVPRSYIDTHGFERLTAKNTESPAVALQDLLAGLAQTNPEAVERFKTYHKRMLKENNIEHPGI